jgi:hypothetical protein
VIDASAQLIAFLATATQFCVVELYTITLSNGNAYRFSAGEASVTIGGNTYSLTGLNFRRGKMSTKLGLTVATLDVDIYANAQDTSAVIGSTPFGQFARLGGLDGAFLRLERLIMPAWGEFLPGSSTLADGVITKFYGIVDDIKFGASNTSLRIASLTKWLNRKQPHNLYQPGCIHTLYDAGCTLSKATFSTTGIAHSGSTTTVIQTSLTDAAGRYDLGTLRITSGDLNGQMRTIKSYDGGGQFTLAYPLTAAPIAGVTVTASLGCDKQRTTCNDTFNNLVNFGGTPYVPVVETAH